MWYMHDFGGLWPLIGGAWMFLLWGGLIALLIWGIIRLTGRREVNMEHTPLDMAKARYARGEITREQFEQIKMNLL